MTQFILHGGASTTPSQKNKNFFESFTNFSEKKTIRILLCYFAKEKRLWNQRFVEDTKRIRQETDKRVKTTLVQNIKHLKSEIKNHDVLYICGGHYNNFEPYIEKLQNLEQLIKDKVFIGSSLGAFIVCSHYILSFDNNDHAHVKKGFGLLPISLLCHWDVEKYKSKKIQLLKNQSAKPVLTLEEGQFIRFYQ